jgi:hypothetical protein
MEVGAIVQGVHLVDPDPGEVPGPALEFVEEPYRLAVGDGYDQLCPGRQLGHEGVDELGDGDGRRG